MDRAYLLRFGAILVVVFFVSVGFGAFVGRLKSPPTVANVATPTPGATVASTASPSPVPPTNPPTAAPPSAAPPTPTVAPTVSLDPATAEDFAADLLAAFQTGNTQYLADRLHPAVFARYGEQQCRDHVAAFSPDPSADWTVISNAGPAAWSWETDAFATIIPDAWSVTVNETAGPRDLHFAPSDGEWRWFLDCGNPK